MKLDSARTMTTSPRKSTHTNGPLSHRTNGSSGASGPPPTGLKKNTRPLGSVRKSTQDLTTLNGGSSVTKFPPLPKTVRSTDDTQMLGGIAGSAMTVPPPKPPTEKQPVIERLAHNSDHSGNNGVHTSRDRVTDYTVRRSTSSPRRLIGSTLGSAKSDSSNKVRPDSGRDREIKQLKDTHAKEIKDAQGKEKDLKSQIALLEKEIVELKGQISSKDELISQLQQEIKAQEEKYKALYEKECKRHRETQDYLSGVKKDLEKTQAQLTQLTKEFDAKLLSLKTQMEQELSTLRTEKDKEILIRDEKLNKLKKQMAEALKGNSWERQQQLDELSKELAKVQEECDMLRMKIRAVAKQAPKAAGATGASCSNCDVLKKQLNEKDSELAKIILISAKYEKQLSEQDELLHQFAVSKGYKGKGPP